MRGIVHLLFSSSALGARDLRSSSLTSRGGSGTLHDYLWLPGTLRCVSAVRFISPSG